MTVTFDILDVLVVFSFLAVTFLLWKQWSFYNSNTGTLLRLYQRYEKFAWKNKEFYLAVFQTVFGLALFDSLESKEAKALEALKDLSPKEGFKEIVDFLKTAKAKADAKSTDDTTK